MPTVNELYDKFVKPTLAEDMARAHFRQQSLTETLAKKRHDKSIDPRCARTGHTPTGSWSEAKTPSGKTYQKCRTCGCGYEVAAQAMEAIPARAPLHEDFPDVTPSYSGPRFVHGTSPA